jgi:hypothetical protein
LPANAKITAFVCSGRSRPNDGIAAKLESVSIADLIREPVVPLGCSFPEREGP